MANKWRCGNCGYRLEADAPPEQCPGCKEKCDFIDDNPYVPPEETTAHYPVELQPVVVPEKCTGCKICLTVCPEHAIVMRGKVAWIDPARCDGDGICVPSCPELAIVLPKE